MHTYAPWALERCTTAVAVDSVCVCYTKEGDMVPVGEEHPLRKCKHFVAAAYLGEPLGGAGHSLEQFYQTLGVVVPGTVCDGDCGIDVMCNMLQLPQTLDARSWLRQDSARGKITYSL